MSSFGRKMLKNVEKCGNVETCRKMSSCHVAFSPKMSKNVEFLSKNVEKCRVLSRTMSMYVECRVLSWWPIGGTSYMVYLLLPAVGEEVNKQGASVCLCVVCLCVRLGM